MLWLSRYAAGALVGRPNDPTAGDEDKDDRGKDDLKTHAVFVLSQLRNHEGVPALLDIARSNRDPQVRGQALFWLGQSGDPRALALFESILRG
jgi:HEAT repeat protein